MNVVLALRFVEKSVPAGDGDCRTVRVLQQQTGEVEVSHMTNELFCRAWNDWADVPLEKE